MAEDIIDLVSQYERLIITQTTNEDDIMHYQNILRQAEMSLQTYYEHRAHITQHVQTLRHRIEQSGFLPDALRELAEKRAKQTMELMPKTGNETLSFAPAKPRALPNVDQDRRRKPWSDERRFKHQQTVYERNRLKGMVGEGAAPTPPPTDHSLGALASEPLPPRPRRGRPPMVRQIMINPPAEVSLPVVKPLPPIAPISTPASGPSAAIETAPKSTAFELPKPPQPVVEIVVEPAPVALPEPAVPTPVMATTTIDQPVDTENDLKSGLDDMSDDELFAVLQPREPAPSI
jgi:hypothetical protein